MKLQILRDIVLADNVVSNPHMVFKKDETIKTDNEYVIDTLLQTKAAKILEKIDSKDDLVESDKSKDGEKIKKQEKKKCK